ncbi:hypothetical protein ACFE04_011671 [Oxalis oulophora]
MKLIKVNSSVLSLSTSHGLKRPAVGSDQGYFEACNLHGFDKNLLVIATKDLSVSIFESDTGNMLSIGMVHPKKRSLPDLSLLKETMINGFAYSTPEPNSFPDTVICSSLDGEHLLVNGDEEIFAVSEVLLIG